MKYLLIILLSAFLFSCSASDDDNNSENNCNLISFEPAQLYYEFFPRQDLGFRVNGFDENFEGIQIEYAEDDRITRIIGGPTAVPAGVNLTDFIMTDLIQYEVNYSGNNIDITTIFDFDQTETITNYYTITNSRILERSVIRPRGIANERIDFTYEYIGNKVFEYENEELFRTFYFENNNLIKVEELIYFNPDNIFEDSDMLYGKYEIIFSEFDNLPNLLKGEFFIDGAFFKSFSDNNYHRVEDKYYLYNQQTEEFEWNNNTNWRSYNFGVNDDDSSGLFTTDCLIEN
ncbi:MAG: hypothetical protein KDD26_06075 [Winogradskyella sp.]|nr:hypothetical protein [Winogradskyella sp.]